MMRYSRLLLLAFVLILPWADHAFPQGSSERETLKSVKITDTQRVRSAIIETRDVSTTQADLVQVKTLRVMANRVTFSLALPQNAEESSLSRFKSDENALAVFTGGFLDTYSPATPAGLVQHHDMIQNELRDDPVMKAVVCYLSDPVKPVAIMAANEFKAGVTKGDCIQTGPFLALNGKEATDFDALEKSLPDAYPFARGLFQRSFLALNARNEITIGVSTRISLFALRDLLLRSASDHGFGATIAVGLSGTRTAGFVIEADGKRITAGAVQTLLPNAGVIKER